MTLDKILVTVIGILSIFFTYWFFLGKKENIVDVKDSIDIKVEGGYSPSVISVPKGKTTKINFLRNDPNSCLEEVTLSEFKIKKFLPLGEKITVEITPQKEGTFPFTCGMNMYHGKLIVK